MQPTYLVGKLEVRSDGRHHMYFVAVPPVKRLTMREEDITIMGVPLCLFGDEIGTLGKERLLLEFQQLPYGCVRVQLAFCEFRAGV